MLASRKTLWRLTRYLGFTFLTLLFLERAFEAWTKYSSKDVIMASKSVQPSLQTFPTVSICKGPSNQVRHDGDVEKALDENSSMENVMAMFGFNAGYGGLTKVSEGEAAPGWHPRPESRHFPMEPNPVFCHTFTPDEMVTPGLKGQLSLYLKVNYSADFLYILLHERSQDISVSGEIFGTATILPEMPKDGIVNFIEYKIFTKQILKLDTEESPCSEDQDPEKSLLGCVEEVFQDRHGCRLPWRSGNSDKICEDEELENYTKFIQNITDRPTFKTLFEQTGCMHSCNQTSYTYTRSWKTDGEVREDMDYNLYAMLFLSPNGLTLERETLVFDALEMLGSVGGYLGLLLGWSLFSIFDSVMGKTKLMLVKGEKK